MNHVERFHAVMSFQPVDRLPRIEWAAWWDQTVNRWVSEGLPTADRYEMYEYFGLDPYYQHWFGAAGPGCPPPPGHGQGIIADATDYDPEIPLVPRLTFIEDNGATGDRVRTTTLTEPATTCPEPASADPGGGVIIRGDFVIHDHPDT